jgi:hypothetical protein
LLLAHGHPEAWSYPLWFVWSEANIVIGRLNADHGTTAVLAQRAGLSMPNMAIKAQHTAKESKAFAKLVKDLIGD